MGTEYFSHLRVSLVIPRQFATCGKIQDLLMPFAPQAPQISVLHLALQLQ
jgi:hypothetical protein